MQVWCFTRSFPRWADGHLRFRRNVNSHVWTLRKKVFGVALSPRDHFPTPHLTPRPLPGISAESWESFPAVVAGGVSNCPGRDPVSGWDIFFTPPPPPGFDLLTCLGKSTRRMVFAARTFPARSRASLSILPRSINFSWYQSREYAWGALCHFRFFVQVAGRIVNCEAVFPCPWSPL